MGLKYFFYLFVLLSVVNCNTSLKHAGSLQRVKESYSQKKYIQSIQNINYLIDSDSLNKDSAYEAEKIKARCLFELQEYEACIILISKLIESHDDPELYLLRGDNYYFLNRVYNLNTFDSAFINYTISIDRFKNIDGYNKRTLIYFNIEDYDLAMQDINQVLDIDSLNWAALNNKGIVLYKQKKYSEAFPAFKRALILKADQFVLFNLASTFEKLGQMDSACLYYQIALDSGYYNAKNKIAEMCR